MNIELIQLGGLQDLEGGRVSLLKPSFPEIRLSQSDKILLLKEVLENQERYEKSRVLRDVVESADSFDVDEIRERRACHLYLTI